MSESILDKHEFQDGRIVLYRRGDIGDNSNYSVRLRIPKASGYVIRSSGTSDLFQARKFAEDLYDQLRLKVLNGESLRDHPFDKCVEIYKKELDILTFRTEKERKEVKAYFDNYPLRHFGSKSLTKVGDQEVIDFISWRMKNPVRKESVQVNSVRAELNTLRKFFQWAKRQKFIAAVPEIKKPKAGKNRRPHFDPKDWNKLAQYLRKFATHENKNIERDRIMLWSYVLILANTGIRVGEARNLKWRDISQITQPEDITEPANIALQVTGKTGPRLVVARTPEVRKYFARILTFRRTELDGKDPEPDSFVFCHKDGKPIQSFKKSFNTLMKDAGVEKDTHGQRRTIYSLRHTYATFRLQEGVNHFHLARNMGTSVAMLENFYGHTSNIAAADELTKTSSRSSGGKKKRDNKTKPLSWILK